MPDPNYLSEIEREDGTVLTIKDAEARAAIDGMDPTLQQILQGVNDIKSSIGDVDAVIDEILDGPTFIEKTVTANGVYRALDEGASGYSKVTVDVELTSEKDVNFYDYDGTIVASYTSEEFADLSAMPENPTHEGLTSQGWNWSLADAKTYLASYRKLNIGQMYITSDGKTRLYISLPEGRTSPILQLYLNSNSELDIDWGDGSTHSTFTSTSAGYKSERHEYSAAGDYVIAITVVSGGFVLQSSSQYVSRILWNGNNLGSSPDAVYNNAIKKIEIGNNVTSIGDDAFRQCYSLSLITISNSVTSIGGNAFYQCVSLSSVTIPNNVTSIGRNAFLNCYSLSSVTIPNSITSIKHAFGGCQSLSAITIPDSVTDIDSAFYQCVSLSSVTIPDSVTSWDSAFGYCSRLSSVTIPNSVTSIGNSAFSYCSALSSVTIPNNVTSIGSYAFQHCTALSSVTIPNNVTGIGQSAFLDCFALSSVTISNNVTSISQNTFYNCGSLSSIAIPDSVTRIGYGAFNNCSYMSYIKFESTTPPTVANSDAWRNVSTSTKILVPAGTLETYKSATNYPNPDTYTYEEY